MKILHSINLVEEGLSIVAIALLAALLLNDILKTQRQINALTGNIKHELSTNPDSTRTWREIK